jgi:carbonic anhydrase
VEDWVRIGQPAKKKVQTECKALNFDDQCSVLEKVRRIPSVILH